MKTRSRRTLLRLEIDPVIAQAERIAQRVRSELPGHEGIARASQGVADAAHEAKHVASRLKRPWGLHRLPATFLAVALLLLAAGIYWHFFHISRLVIAVPERDAVRLHERLSGDPRIRFRERLTKGSRENVRLLSEGHVDLAFVQGGIPISRDLPLLVIGHREMVLYFVRDGVQHPAQIRCVLTSVEGQGSHSVAEVFFGYWRPDGSPVRYLHQWSELSGEADYAVPAEVDAVFVIKDLANERTYRGARRLAAAGFRLQSPELGARAAGLDYLQAVEIPEAYLGLDPPVPAEAISTYTVATYLVARHGLTPRVTAAAAKLLDADPNRSWEPGFEPTFSDAGAALQTVEATLGIVVYTGLAFLALLGIEITTYRRRFHELNTLISLISIHQSDKDVLGLRDDARRQENLLYLSMCSDLLGLIAVISGYYAQENSSLLYSNLLEIIHHRSSGLKLNIQTKILHAAIALTPMAGDAPDVGETPDSHSPSSPDNSGTAQE
jgi:hypothetical protein